MIVIASTITNNRYKIRKYEPEKKSVLHYLNFECNKLAAIQDSSTLLSFMHASSAVKFPESNIDYVNFI